ncbi:Solute carrier family 35 member F6 [Zancudomyces culisetae]|uniref:Solute carrier family 35 member F6 n=1 Tax=Zancudomyces culisetae TaxID=1213189 RepID=A0A1R1PZ91_ZANCU|nr:Solute carrier family 35 member F6 [Zancudomyces culisetae]|eukprot:OMH86273.1 Solute carrier family 35 member F6 [Zancudomyces culisetae]
MSTTNSYKTFLALGMLLTGTLNTIFTKFQDKICVENCSDPDPRNHKEFNQPVWQTLNMFIGEILCMVVFYAIQLYTSYKNNRDGYNEIAQPSRPEPRDIEVMSQHSDNLIGLGEEGSALAIEKRELTGLATFYMWFPAAFDIIGTTLLNVGLIYTTASVYQMLRGVVVSMDFVIFDYAWRINCCADFSKSFVGVVIVLLAQIFGAFQFIVEEKVLTDYSVQPLRGVGLEGIFGAVTVTALIPILHYKFGVSDPGGFFDAGTAIDQILNNASVLRLCFYIMLSIAFFNWFGLSVTKTMSATSRTTIDACR